MSASSAEGAVINRPAVGADREHLVCRLDPAACTATSCAAASPHPPSTAPVPLRKSDDEAVVGQPAQAAVPLSETPASRWGPGDIVDGDARPYGRRWSAATAGERAGRPGKTRRAKSRPRRPRWCLEASDRGPPPGSQYRSPSRRPVPGEDDVVVHGRLRDTDTAGRRVELRRPLPSSRIVHPPSRRRGWNRTRATCRRA